MNPKICLAFATLAVLCNVSSAIFFTTGAAATGAATTGALTLSTGGAAAGLALGGGLLLLKGLAIGALAASRGRGKRSTGLSLDNDASFAVIASVEPAQCYRRLICDLATGQMAKSENDVILSLFNKESSIASPKFEFSTAAKLGREIKDVQACELRYSCPVSGDEIQALFA